VVANKIDLLPRPAAVLKSLERRTDLPVVGVSGREHLGIEKLLAALRRVVQEGQP
jgi:50S ribosomal subunit-associated GTPase HflX